MNSKRCHTIRIYWTYPRNLNTCIYSPYYENEFGLYYITRQYKLKNSPIFIERNLYVGETKRSFKIRLNEHKKDGSNWIYSYGYKYVRFGIIENLPHFEEERELKRFLRTIETSIIFKLNENPCNPVTGDLINISQTRSGNIFYNLKIVNRGFHGEIPTVIYTSEFL